MEPATDVCVNHPTATAVVQCGLCGTAVCETCDFSFLEKHACPACVVSAEQESPARRKPMLAGSYAAAAVASVLLLTMLVAADNWTEEAAGCVFVLLLPTAISGTVFAFPIRRPAERRTVAEWIAILWNAGLLGIFTLLMITGLMME